MYIYIYKLKHIYIYVCVGASQCLYHMFTYWCWNEHSMIFYLLLKSVMVSVFWKIMVSIQEVQPKKHGENLRHVPAESSSRWMLRWQSVRNGIGWSMLKLHPEHSWTTAFHLIPKSKNKVIFTSDTDQPTSSNHHSSRMGWSQNSSWPQKL